MINGSLVSYSSLKHPLINTLIDEGLVKRKLQGRTKSILYVENAEQLTVYISNHFGINNLPDYIAGYRNEELTRSEAIEISSNSKLKHIRSFKGFLVNAYNPISAALNSRPLTVKPTPGTYTFIYDYESFSLPDDITVVGIENPENFRYIEKQKKYFDNLKPLFVSRYPQGKDLINWLTRIPNPYLHFGDFDFEGINIYLNEYKKYLKDKASFFVPSGISQLIQSFGNRELYDKQFSRQTHMDLISEEQLKNLLMLFHQHKKVLEQEVLINR